MHQERSSELNTRSNCSVLLIYGFEGKVSDLTADIHLEFLRFDVITTLEIMLSTPDDLVVPAKNN